VLVNNISTTAHDAEVKMPVIPQWMHIMNTH
jgi:hypothetical protein